MRSALCFVLAALSLFVAGRTGLGGAWFFAATVACALALLLGSRRPARPTALLIDVPLGLAAGLLLLLPSALGAAALWAIPFFDPLTAQIGGLLGSSPPRAATLLGLLAVVLLNALGEEFFFRGTLPRYFPRHPIAVPTALYAAMTAVFGAVLVPLAAVYLGLSLHLLRARTGGLTAPITAHVVWTCAMIGVVAALEWGL